MRAVIVIPARMKSTRFPAKPLVPLMGKPMVLHVAALSAECLGRENTYVATDSLQIKDVVEAAGFQAVMTSEEALTGTDRVAEAAESIDADIFINVQGDEPLVWPSDINRVLEAKEQSLGVVTNGVVRMSNEEDPLSANIPKVAMREDGYLVYMSRLPIPGVKDEKNKPFLGYYKQICIYAFTFEELKAFRGYERRGELEFYEDIEILRFFELGIPIKMVELEGASLAVDVPADVALVEEQLRRRQICLVQ